MKKYSKYKHSVVEWIGDVPEGWYVVKLKYICDYLTDGSHFSPKTEDQGRFYITVSDVTKQNSIDFTHCKKINNESFDDLVKTGCQPIKGDIIITKDGTIGRGVIVDDFNDFVILSSLGLIRLKPYFSNKFILYYLLSGLNIDQMYSNIRGSGITRLTITLISDLFVIIPPLPEQSQIVDFLDQKTSIIDDLIHKKLRKIELLKEQRTTIINQTVTKGLNLDVKVKDSGVEWIGEIPEGWFTTKIKYVTNLIVDGTHFTPNYIDEGVPFLRVTDIQQDTIDFDRIKYISKEEHLELSKRCNPKMGDLLLSKNGTIGITKIVNWDWEFSIFVSLCLIRFKVDFNPKLFTYFFQSDIVDQQIKESSKQSTVTNLHLEKIRELILIKPPISEQNQIVDYLDKKTTEIDTTITLENKKIELLKEYRQTLISDVVTGKLDVRKN